MDKIQFSKVNPRDIVMFTDPTDAYHPVQFYRSHTKGAVAYNCRRDKEITADRVLLPLVFTDKDGRQTYCQLFVDGQEFNELKAGPYDTLRVEGTVIEEAKAKSEAGREYTVVKLMPNDCLIEVATRGEVERKYPTLKPSEGAVNAAPAESVEDL